jgi:hypothetical protein
MTYSPTSAYTGSFTVIAWIKPDSTTKAYQTFVDSRAPGTTGPLSGDVSFDFKLTGTDEVAGQALCTDVGDGVHWLEAVVPPLGCTPFRYRAHHWYFVAMTVAPAARSIRTYVDDNLLGHYHMTNYGLPPLLFDATHPFTIGGNARIPVENFDGVIGQVAIFPSVLSRVQLTTVYRAGHDA